MRCLPSRYDAFCTIASDFLPLSTAIQQLSSSPSFEDWVALNRESRLTKRLMLSINGEGGKKALVCGKAENLQIDGSQTFVQRLTSGEEKVIKNGSGSSVRFQIFSHLYRYELMPEIKRQTKGTCNAKLKTKISEGARPASSSAPKICTRRCVISVIWP